MREGTRVDADGFHVFTLDEGKHNPFVVLDRLMTTAGYVAPAIDLRFEAMKAMKPNELARFDPAYAQRLARENAK
jgi:hypothetical protein